MRSALRFLLPLLVATATIACGERPGREPAEEEYSLWLVPSGAQYDSLHQLMCELAARYPSHCFVPHVTVVGEVKGSLEEATRRARALARRTGPLEARLTTIAWAPDEYYRAFYLVVEETPAFTKLYEDTCEIAGKCHRRPYHLSLLYTDKLSDQEKVAIRDSLYAARGGPAFGMPIRITRLLMCSTSGLPPEQWTCPAEIRLEERPP